MNYLFIIELVIFIVLLPGVLLMMILRYLSMKFRLNYKMIGYLKFRDILFVLENEDYILKIQIDYFKIYLVWLRIRFYFRNLNVDFELTNKNIDNFNDGLYHNNKNNKAPTLEKKTEETSTIDEVKERLCKMIREKYINKHSTQTSEISDEIVEDILKSIGLSRKEKFIRNLIVFFDIVFENIMIVYRITNNDFYHSAFIKKVLIGAVKGLNKVFFI